MERDYHINIKRTLVAVDIAKLETEIFVSVFFGSFVAFFNNIFLKVKSDDCCINLFDLRQIIVNDKCEVRFTTAEVDDIEFFIVLLTD